MYKHIPCYLVTKHLQPLKWDVPVNGLHIAVYSNCYYTQPYKDNH